MAKSRVVTGHRLIDHKLSKMPAKAQKALLRKALRVTAKEIQADAKRRAPDESGLLRRSIKVRAGKRSRTRISVEVRTDPRNFEREDTVYAFFIERGTKFAAPQPFLLPALKAASRSARVTFERAMRTLISEAARG